MNAITDVQQRFEKSLPDVLEFSGEFGTELALFMPFCFWLSKVGLLKQRRIRIYRGMRCFYDELDCLEITEKTEARNYVPPQKQPDWLPVKNPHNFDGHGRSPFHFFPDLRKKFLRLPLAPDIGTTRRPLLIIHNKHNNEWNAGPVNHITVDTLDALFHMLEKGFTVVYIRHGMGLNAPGFADDHNTTERFEDRALLNRHPDVLCFDDVYSAHVASGGTQDLNTFKNVLYSRCYRFISSQGGGALQIALFSGSLLVILHRKGSEEAWAYGDGYYGFMANIPPLRAICRSDPDLLSAGCLFEDSAVAEDRLLLSPRYENILMRFSPWTIARRS